MLLLNSVSSDSEESKTLFDTILSNSIGKSEGSVEKKLRETGEWILDKTEGSSSRSAGIFLLLFSFVGLINSLLVGKNVLFGIFVCNYLLIIILI